MVERGSDEDSKARDVNIKLMHRNDDCAVEAVSTTKEMSRNEPLSTLLIMIICKLHST